MTIVSSRSYIAAGLAAAMAGMVMTSPMLAQRPSHLPTVSSARVELSSLASGASEEAVVDAQKVHEALRHIAASVPREALTASTGVAGVVGG